MEQSLTPLLKEMNLLNAQDTRIYRDATKTREERISAIDRIIEREEKLSEVKEKLTNFFLE